MMVRLSILGAGLAAAFALAPLEAYAQAKAPAASFRCIGKDGKKYYGSAIPPQCVGPVEAMSAQGTVLYRIDPEGEERARKEKEADIARKKEQEVADKEVRRRNSALLATYTSEKDIEEARGRALADNAKLVKEVEARIAAIQKRKDGYAKEMEFYAETKVPEKSGKAKPGAAPAAVKAGPKPPPKLVEDMRMADVDMKLQQEALEERKKQVDIINGKYDEDKKRFQALITPPKR
jgi:hypothetical protein